MSNFVELRENELLEVNGGSIFAAIAGGFSAVVGAAYSVGYAIGKAIAHAGY